MLYSTHSKVLLPERIVKERNNWTKQNFDFAVLNYLTRYPKYRLIRVEGSFAICDRGDEAKERRKKRE